MPPAGAERILKNGETKESLEACSEQKAVNIYTTWKTHNASAGHLQNRRKNKMEPTLGSQLLGVCLVATIAFFAGWYGNRIDARKRAKKERLARLEAELVAQYEEDMRLYHEEQRKAEAEALAMARKAITPAFEY